MYCSNCGNKIDEHADVCIHCGVMIQKSKNKKKNGKGIASLVLGIIAIYFCISAFVACGQLDVTLAGYDGPQRFGFAIGFILIQTVFSVTGFCLAVSERNDNRNGFNTAGFWLGIGSFVCMAFQFLYVLFY